MFIYDIAEYIRVCACMHLNKHHKGKNKRGGGDNNKCNKGGQGRPKKMTLE